MRRSPRLPLAAAVAAAALALPLSAGAQAPGDPVPPAPPAPPGVTPPAPPTPPVPAPPGPEPISSYVSPSGDITLRTRARGAGQIYLELGAQARYFARYRLCVSAPTRRRDCRVFTLRRRGRIYGSVVRWQRSFPPRGVGTYRVTWSAEGNRLGPALVFIIR
ncbi:MAG: hypothetical protein H0V55_05170 [Thermoleophilaceae bacterium]|nr:hypothetical protein [Thermoleophilaceae bacterium]